MSINEVTRTLELVARPLILELMRRGYCVELDASESRASADPEQPFFVFSVADETTALTAV